MDIMKKKKFFFKPQMTVLFIAYILVDKLRKHGIVMWTVWWIENWLKKSEDCDQWHRI